MTINSASTFNDYIQDTVDQINSLYRTVIPNWSDIKVVFETLNEDYPMVSLDYYQVLAWSERRNQYYDALFIHVKVTQNDDWLARKILQHLDVSLGFAKNSVLHRQLVETLDVNALAFTELEAGVEPNVLPDNIELVADNRGWMEGGTDNMRHYYRALQIFYHK